MIELIFIGYYLLLGGFVGFMAGLLGVGGGSWCPSIKKEKHETVQRSRQLIIGCCLINGTRI